MRFRRYMIVYKEGDQIKKRYFWTAQNMIWFSLVLHDRRMFKWDWNEVYGYLWKELV